MILVGTRCDRRDEVVGMRLQYIPPLSMVRCHTRLFSADARVVEVMSCTAQGVVCA